MKIILFSDDFNDIGERLQAILEKKVPKESLYIVKTIKDLSLTLRRFWDNVSIAVIAVSTQTDLLKISSIKDLFEGLRIILILPDRKRETISLGLKLYPSYFSYQDSNLLDVSIVLDKCLAI